MYWLPLQVFDSHCAPEPVANMQPEQLTIAKLKDRLKELNLPLNGRKVCSPIHARICVLSVVVLSLVALHIAKLTANPAPGETLSHHKHNQHRLVTVLILLMRVS